MSELSDDALSFLAESAHGDAPTPGDRERLRHKLMLELGAAAFTATAVGGSSALAAAASTSGAVAHAPTVLGGAAGTPSVAAGALTASGGGAAFGLGKLLAAAALV